MHELSGSRKLDLNSEQEKEKCSQAASYSLLALVVRVVVVSLSSSSLLPLSTKEDKTKSYFFGYILDKALNEYVQLGSRNSNVCIVSCAAHPL